MFNKISTLSTEIKSDLERRTLTGYASVFGVRDSAGDIVLPGAFSESIKERFDTYVSEGKPPRIHFLYQHEARKPVGTILELKEDKIGLWFKAKVSQTQLGDDLLNLVRDKSVEGLSFGYNVQEEQYDGKRRANLLKRLDILEISVVTFPANEACRLKSEYVTQEHGLGETYGEAGERLGKLVDELVQLKAQIRAKRGAQRMTPAQELLQEQWLYANDRQRRDALEAIRADLALQILLSGGL